MDKITRISRRTGIPRRDVEKVLAADTDYAYGTVVRAFEGANLAIYTPDGWVSIPNTSYRGSHVMEPKFVRGWEIVYDPDEFNHQTRIGEGNGEGELVV